MKHSIFQGILSIDLWHKSYTRETEADIQLNTCTITVKRAKYLYLISYSLLFTPIDTVRLLQEV